MRPDAPTPRESPSAPRRAAAAPSNRRPLGTLMILGIVFVVLGLLSFAYIGWQYYGTNFTANQAMATEMKDLQSKWKDDSIALQQQVHSSKPATPEGTFALLRIPRLGADYVKPIVAGVEAPELAKGVGWYKYTAQPGQIGNFAIAGHRITHGEPFARLLEVKVGDKVEIETQDSIFIYEITTAPSEITVTDTKGGWVLEPKPAADPSKRGGKPVEALITLTTCTDLFASPDRSVGFGKLVETKKK